VRAVLIWRQGRPTARSDPTVGRGGG
jgi:hypothetical protein